MDQDAPSATVASGWRCRRLRGCARYSPKGKEAGESIVSKEFARGTSNTKAVNAPSSDRVMQHHSQVRRHNKKRDNLAALAEGRAGRARRGALTTNQLGQILLLLLEENELCCEVRAIRHLLLLLGSSGGGGGDSGLCVHRNLLLWDSSVLA